ncbi:MAG: endonuclease dU [Candidatus Hodarchaeales archaeon]
MKKQIRALGVATAKVDFSQDPIKKKETTLIGVIQRGSTIIEKIFAIPVEIDSVEITDVIQSLFKNPINGLPRVKVVFTKSIFLAGFSIFDLHKFHQKTGIPAVAILKKSPILKNVESAIAKNFSDFQQRLSLMKKQGPVKQLISDDIYFQSPCLTADQTRKFLEIFNNASKIPESLRIAVMVSNVF